VGTVDLTAVPLPRVSTELDSSPHGLTSAPLPLALLTNLPYIAVSSCESSESSQCLPSCLSHPSVLRGWLGLSARGAPWRLRLRDWPAP
jgi:hypothetical protein